MFKGEGVVYQNGHVVTDIDQSIDYWLRNSAQGRPSSRRI